MNTGAVRPLCPSSRSSALPRTRLQSYYFSPDRTEFVTIDNPSSIRSKIEWIKAGGYLGAFWWEFHHDYVAPGAENPQGSHYLIDIVTRYLGRK